MDKRKVIKEYLQSIIVAVLIALFIRTFIIQSFYIPSGSMEPTLLVGDYLLVNKFIYGIKIPFTETKVLPIEKPRRGDVIVFIYPVNPSLDFIKRVIATGGEKLQIVQNKIYINDIQISDPWGYFKRVGPTWLYRRIENYGPVIVPKNSLFVMGDNRDDSEDSRFWGFLPIQNVIGKAFLIYFSWDHQAKSPWNKIRWTRVFQWIH